MNASQWKQWIEEAQADSTLEYHPRGQQDNDENTTTFLGGRTQTDITEETTQLLAYVGKPEYMAKLQYYRYIDSIHELQYGRIIRCLHKQTKQLETPGMVADIKFLSNGIHVVVRLFNHRHIQYRFDDFFLFQKLTADEMLILSALDDDDDNEDKDNNNEQ